MAPTKEENGDETQSNTPEYRDRLRTWLIKIIDSGTIPGLYWENEEKTIFRMPWKHAGRQDYSLEEDSRIFMAWAIHSGRHREGIDKPEPIIWKTRLRCALNKMPDICEIPDRSRLDISEPYRVYHLLPPVHKDSQIRRRLQRRHSHVQTSDSARHASHQTSPISPRKDSTTSSSTDHIKFPDPRLQGQVCESATGINQPRVNQPPRFDLRNTAPWLTSPPLVPNAENRLFPGLNLNYLTSQVTARNLINPYNLFSIPHRDQRQRSDFDIPLFPYQNPVLDPQYLHQFLMPPRSIPGQQLAGNPTVSGSSFSRSLAEEKYDRSKTNKVRTDEKDDAICKIELLELEIEKWKRAFENEKALRESTEQKHDHLQSSLRNMGGNILAIIQRSYPFKDDTGEETASATPPSSTTPTRRRSTDDKSRESFSGEVSPRTGRHSAEEELNGVIQEAKNEWCSKRNSKKRSEEDDSNAMDLSCPSPTKRPRDSLQQRNEGRNPRHNFQSCLPSEREGAAIKMYHGAVNSTERALRFSSSSILSSDCDEADAASSSNNQTLVKSPSTSSSCSSAEESMLGSSHSPSITRSSPLVPIFRASNSNSYPSYNARVDGPIQVT